MQRKETVADVLKIDITLATPLTEEEAKLPMTFDIPDVKNGEWIMIRGRGRTIYFIEDGIRRPCPDMDTFIAMGGTLNNISTLASVGDPRYGFEIAVGPLLPHMHS